MFTQDFVFVCSTEIDNKDEVYIIIPSSDGKKREAKITLNPVTLRCTVKDIELHVIHPRHRS
jgi:hypothetical protein